MSQSGKLMVWPSMRIVSLSSFCQRHANFFLKKSLQCFTLCVSSSSQMVKNVLPCYISAVHHCIAVEAPIFPTLVWSTAHQRLIAMTTVDVSYS